MKKKKVGMKLEAANPVSVSTFRNLKPRGITTSASGPQTYLPKKSKKATLTDFKSYSGLCLCCSCASVCTYPRDLGRPVLQCEEFEGISMSQVSIETTSVNRRSKFASHTQRSGHSTGLCATCENLNACTYPKPEGGVWHCEEYC